MSAYVVGLTGGIACGKTNLSDALKGIGVPVIDADEISRRLTGENGQALPEIRKAFGDAVFDGGKLDRKALGKLIFQNEEARRQLNDLMHPLIFKQMKEELSRCSSIVFLDVPLLYECGLDAWCDEVWCTYIPQKEQINRLIIRDQISRKAALERIHAQMPVLEKARKADRVIRTDGSMEKSAETVLSMYRDLRDRLEATKENFVE